MSTPYEVRTRDTSKTKKQSMAELKLRRLNELNQRLQEDLNRRRIPVSEAAMEYVLPVILRLKAMPFQVFLLDLCDSNCASRLITLQSHRFH